MNNTQTNKQHSLPLTTVSNCTQKRYATVGHTTRPNKLFKSLIQQDINPKFHPKITCSHIRLLHYKVNVTMHNTQIKNTV